MNSLLTRKKCQIPPTVFIVIKNFNYVYNNELQLIIMESDYLNLYILGTLKGSVKFNEVARSI